MDSPSPEHSKRPDRDISLARQRIANDQTAQYVDLHMRDVQSVSSRFDVHKVCSTHASNTGLILEFGVYQGRTINFIASLFPSSPIFGFDSFQGLPEDWCDGNPKGVFAVNTLPAVANNVTLHPGLFSETLPLFVNTLNTDIHISYIHIDCDLYSSTKTVFQFLQPFILPGTVLVFDEYFNYPGWQHDEYLAFKEFIAFTGLRYDYLCYNRQGHQVGVKIKSNI